MRDSVTLPILRVLAVLAGAIPIITNARDVSTQGRGQETPAPSDQTTKHATDNA